MKTFKTKTAQKYYDPSSPDLYSDLEKDVDWFENPNQNPNQNEEPVAEDFIDKKKNIDNTVNIEEGVEENILEDEKIEDEANIEGRALNADDLLQREELPVVNREDIEGFYVEKAEDEDDFISEESEIEEPDGYPDFNNFFEALLWAEKNHETIRINYKTLKGTPIVRDVEPHSHFFAKTTRRRCLISWDQTVEGIRSFVLNGIYKNPNFEKGYKFTGEKFEPKFVFSRI